MLQSMISKPNLCNMKQGWEIKKLGDVCEKLTDGSHNPPKGILHSDYLMLSSQNIHNDKILFDDVRFLSKDDFIKEDKRTLVREGDILITIVGTIGRCAVFTGNKTITLQRSVAVLRPQNNISSRYLMYCIIGKNTTLNEESHGIAQKGIYLKQLSQIPIPIPPLAEQERIVAELDCLSGVIEKKKQQLKELDALAQSIFYEMFGDPITNEKGWEVKKWEDVLSIVNGKNQKIVENPNGEYPIYGSGGVMGYADKYLCPKNTVIIGRKGNINKPILVKEPFWNVDTAFGLISDKINIDSYFLFFFCRIFNFEQLNKAVTIPSLTKSDLLKINMVCPPLSLQQAFASKIEAIEKQKELIIQSIKEVETLFNSRMDYYFN